LPPEWVTRLPEASQNLKEQVKRAQDQGAFTFASTFSETRHPLYVRPLGLFKRLREELVGKGELDGQPHGVLIWGGKGMGKTSLARDIACAAASDPGKPSLVKSALRALIG
jgi:hypothetical protein